jgi:putative hydrolase of the HAD superfamily
MKYKHIFFDLDHTLWDFDANADKTLIDMYEAFNLESLGINDLKKFLLEYHHINKQMWLDYELGKINQQTLRYKRFHDTLLLFNIDSMELAQKLAIAYLDYLPKRTALMPGALEVLEYLKPKYKIHLITNGFDKVQHQKLVYSNIDHFFKAVITSEFAGYKKPQREIYHFAISEVNAYPSNCIMIGDNLENDVKGAANAGIDQIFYNPVNNPTDFKATHEIQHLSELLAIL